MIQGAQHLLHTMTWLDRWPDDDQRTRIVFIVKDLEPRFIEGLAATREIKQEIDEFVAAVAAAGGEKAAAL